METPARRQQDRVGHESLAVMKNHLTHAVREEVEILKEQILELMEMNSQLECKNTLLKTLASPEQLEKFQSGLSPKEQAPESQLPEALGGSAV
ncbi:TSC22 domain family protein 3-like [Hylobates moloch]|uniref:TSC22 domain family protein 3-like n=1 Tax=Hylobates moloch TaxID=81572 RepID=UPI0013F1DCB5|nr:TSC22 domain family protein 3-like [Hylobates moloch]